MSSLSTSSELVPDEKLRKVNSEGGLQSPCTTGPLAFPKKGDKEMPFQVLFVDDFLRLRQSRLSMISRLHLLICPGCFFLHVPRLMLHT